MPSQSKGSKGKSKGERKEEPAKPGELFSGGWIHRDARYSREPRQVWPNPYKLVPRVLHAAVERWNGWSSDDLLKPGALSKFSSRNKFKIEKEPFPFCLLQQLPEDPSAAAWREAGWEFPAVGGTRLDVYSYLRELCRRHHGEVRELRGYWEQFDGPVTKEMLHPQFNGSFLRLNGAMVVPGQLAPGSCNDEGEMEVRVANVFGLADLFFAFGEHFTAAELYHYYKKCRIIAFRKDRGSRAS